ncbi:unnamed protein product [Rhizoctonia solani]|uniref:Uncharacterized protein n=1 Tax=Rhizoctonia solani TaxID=456999 RepID=A0A8H3GVA7_9AGAM|nr:unnamed protein product [Rhizoctonia solani]
MAPHYETVPLQVPLPQLSKQDFELKVEGADSFDRSPLRGYLGIEPCTWPVTAMFIPTKGTIDIRWIELKVQVYERAYTTHISDIEEVSQVLFQSGAIVFGKEENTSYETITGPRVLSHVFNVPSHMPSALQSKHKRAQVIWKLVFKVYRKSGAFKREYIAHETKFPAIKNYLPIPSIEHQVPLEIQGESPKGDFSWSLASSNNIPTSLYALGDTARVSFVLKAKPGHSIKSQLRSVQLELTEYVVASGEPNVLLDTLYRHKIDTSSNNIESKEGCSCEFDVIIPSKSSPDYTGTFMSVTHRLQVTTAWKGRLLDKVTSHPIAIAALSHSERQRAIEEVAQIETTPSIAPPSRNDDVPPPSYTSTQHLLNESSMTLMPQRAEDELSSISYRSNIDTPTTGSAVHSVAG